MLTYELDRRGNLPAYEYLYRAIRADVLSGRLKPGEKLPSKRGLAEHLGVSVVTVENAYAQLLLEGCIRAEQRRGYFVCALEGVPLIKNGAGLSKAGGFSDSAAGSEPPAREWFADLKTSRTPPEQFPFSLWAKLMREVLSERDPALLSPMPARGLLCLQRAISGYLGRFRGMEVSPEQIVVGAGTESLCGLLVRLLGRDSLFGAEDPGYPRIVQTYRAEGASCVPVPLDREGVDPAALERLKVDVAHLTPAHHFPTGIVTSAARRRELLSWAAGGEGRYLIEDDYDGEFRFSGRPVPALQSMDRAGRVIYVNTFSRTLTPAIRISFLVLPMELSQRFTERLGFASCTVSSFEQAALAKFISGGHFESHLARTRHVYRRRRDDFLAALDGSPLASRCQVLQADAGLHFLLKVDSPYSDRELVSRAAGQGLHLSCLSEYCADPQSAPRGCLVINFPGVSPDRIGETVRRLSWAVLG